MSGKIKKAFKSLFLRIPSSYVLAFHHMSENPAVKKSGCLLDTDKFYEMIDSNRNYASVVDVIKHPSKKQIAITFDDGLEDVYTVAYPYLKRKNIPFTIFVVTDFLDTEGYISTSQLKEMANDPLVTVGSHGKTHEILKSMDSKEQKKELVDSKKILEELIQKSVELFAYSHGQFDEVTLKEVCVYKYAMVVNGLPVNFITKKKKGRIPRLNVDNYSFDKVFKRIKG